MPTLAESIERDYLEAMKAKDTEKVSVLRMVKAALTNYKIEKKKESLGDEDLLEILSKQAKQHQESLESFQKAGRTDLAEKEKKELAILQPYLPKPLTDAEIRAFVLKAIQESGAKSKSDQGKVMKLLMPQVKGKADGKKVSDIVQSLL